MVDVIDKIAFRYAKAFFALADEKNIIKETYQDMMSIKEICASEHHSEFFQFTQNCLIETTRQHDVIDQLFKKSIHAQTLSFLHFLIDKKRLARLYYVCLCFDKLYHEEQKQQFIRIYSSQELEKSQKEAIKEKFQKKLNKEILIGTYTDESLLAGFRVRCDDQVYDFSLKEQFKHLKEKVLTG